MYCCTDIDEEMLRLMLFNLFSWDSEKYDYLYSDDRFLPKKHREKFKPDKIIESNDGYDLTLVWENRKLKEGKNDE